MKIKNWKSQVLALMGTSLLLFSKGNAQEKGILFGNYANWEAVKKDALKNNKPVFLDVYATWCGPCRWMDKEVYPNDAVAEFFNREFLNVKVQLDSLTWDAPEIKQWYASGAEIKKEYKIKAFPTLLFLSPKGELYRKVEGMRDPESLIKEAKDALNPKSQYSTLLSSYEGGKFEPGFVRDLIRLARELGEKVRARQIAQKYISSLKPNEMLELENIWCLYENTKTSKDRGFAFFSQNLNAVEKVEPKMTKDIIGNLLLGIVNAEAIRPYAQDKEGKANWEIIHAKLKNYGEIGQSALAWREPYIRFEDEVIPYMEENPAWEKVRKKVVDYRFDRKQTLILFKSVLMHYHKLVMTKKLLNTKDLILASDFYFAQKDADLRAGLGEHIGNYLAWIAFWRVDKSNIEGLNLALKWSERSMTDEPQNGGYMDTYANLLHKLGRTSDAVVWAEKAHKLSPEDTEIKENYEKIKNGVKTWK